MPTTTRPRHSKSLYSPHPSLAILQKWIADLPARTGRSLEQWIGLVKKEGPASEEARRDWLKSRHKLGTNAAWWIAERAGGKNIGEEDPEVYLATAVGYVEAMYAGKREALRPIHEALIAAALKVGKDVRICPCKTMVPLYRNHVFAEIKPATNTRVDFGLALGALKAQGRLVDTGGYAKKDRITHRIPLSAAGEVDAEVLRWLNTAYELDGH